MKVIMKRIMIMMMVLIGSMLMAQDREVAVVPDDDSVDPGLKAGDIVTIKASNGMGLNRIVAALTNPDTSPFAGNRN